MAEEPQIGWTVDDFRTELATALDWLREQRNVEWDEIYGDFLAQLEVTESQLQTVRYGVYLLLVTYFAEELTGVQRMAFLFEESQQRQKLTEFRQEWDNGLSWVTAEQQAQLDELSEARGDWREWLPDQLNEWWAEWLDSTPEVLAPWLDEDLPSLLGPAPEPDETGVTGLAWVTAGQQAQLDELWEARGDWREWLPDQLSEWWADWGDSTPEVLTPWLDGYLPSLFLPAGLGDEEPAAEEPVTSLSWVTPEQQEQLAGLPRDEDWRVWLPGELDRRIPDWTELTPDELTGRLDAIIGFLALPFDPVAMDISENVVKPAMDELREKVPEMAQTLQMDPDELSAYIDRLSDDFFADRLYEATLELR